MITEAQVLEALSLLGNDPDEIAEHLLDKGCLARYCWKDISIVATSKQTVAVSLNSGMNIASNCPLAVYLQQQFPGEDFSVGKAHIVSDPPKFHHHSILLRMSTPKVCSRFIDSFDNGFYPFLYASEGEVQ